MRTIPTLLALSLIQASAHAAVLFADTFDRADSNNIDASLSGITDNTGSSLAADGVYLHGQIDPNAAHPTYGAPDGNAANRTATPVNTGSSWNTNWPRMKTSSGCRSNFIAVTTPAACGSEVKP